MACLTRCVLSWETNRRDVVVGPSRTLDGPPMYAIHVRIDEACVIRRSRNTDDVG